jgi:hypothetical protein
MPTEKTLAGNRRHFSGGTCIQSLKISAIRKFRPRGLNEMNSKVFRLGCAVYLNLIFLPILPISY